MVLFKFEKDYFMKVTWKGIYQALTTKFKKDDELDWSLLEKKLFAHIDAGLDYILFGGTLGESSAILWAGKVLNRNSATGKVFLWL